jgi:hypothetical protein
MNEKKAINRRQFVGIAVAGAGAVAAGSAMMWMSKRGSLDKRFEYDISEHQTTDPSLVLYEETGKFASGLTQASRLTITKDGQILVAGDQAVHRFDGHGRPKAPIALPDKPQAIAVTGDDKLVVGYRQYFEIRQLDGALVSKSANLGDRVYITAVAMADDHVFVADAGNREILRCTPAGDVALRFGKVGSSENVPGFVVPSPYFDMLIAPDGLLRVANTGRHQVEAYTLDGKFELAWGRASMAVDGFCGCCNPSYFTMLPDGRYITSEKGLNRIKLYDMHGTFKGVVAGPEALVRDKELAKRACSDCQVGFAFDVDCDSKGRVFAIDPTTQQVRIFSPKANS